MSRNTDQSLQNEMRQIESQLATLRERMRVNRKMAAEGFENQVRTLEDQFEYFKGQLDKQKVKSQMAYGELSEATQKAWDDLKGGVNKAYRNIH